MDGDPRFDSLLQAGMTLASELSLPSVLQRIVQLAVELTDAHYGAVGVLGSEERIAEFITAGLSDQARAMIGHIPEGKGILGLLIDDPQPLRLHRIADHPASYGFPPNHPPMVTFLGAPIIARGRVFGNIYLTEKAGGEDFTEEDEDALVTLAAQAGVAIANARIYDESQQRQRTLEALSELSEKIMAGEDAGATLQSVAAHARNLVDADVAMVVSRAEGDGADTATVSVVDGYGAEELLGMKVPLSGSMSGLVMRTGKPEVVIDASSHDDAYPPLVRGADMGPTIYVPLRLRGDVFGTLSVANRGGGRLFTADDLSLVQTFANQASVAVEQARAREEQERLHLLDDRERIGRELHDGVIQALFAVGMSLQGTALASGEEDTRRRLESAVEEIDRTIKDLRNYIFGLRPALLDHGGLGSALEELVTEFASSSGVVTIPEIDPAAAHALAAIEADVVQLVREALSNVRRHASASTSRVSLRIEDGDAVLEVDDDGAGFTIASVKRGLGLGNLKDRAERLGGTAEIQSTPGEGTTVLVRIPVDRDSTPVGMATS